MLNEPSIELLIDEKSGRLVNCYALDVSENRLVQLPIILANERFLPNDPGVVSIDIHSFRVKRTIR